ncbi:hypothetical protein [Bacillus sp. AFS017336]|uniref:hypothetical protein n=1 Tax=Bacillus sp. AFS017336 TaxID=2033489 RepID=UPI000BF0F431|nr:hypothetical protein [Bacillus sp. AFS017336]PEL13290.1 hypothetical protein CN601_05390 [Bacillus sp. AFS017336]
MKVELLTFLIDFVIAAIPILLIAWLICLIFKKHRKEVLLGALSLALLSSFVQFYKSFDTKSFINSITSKKETKKETDKELQKEQSQKSVEFRDLEKGRIERIIIGIQQNDPSFLTQEVHKEFWDILESHGELSENQIDVIKEPYISATTEMGYFYEDAIISLNSKEPFISNKRKDHESIMLGEGLITQEKLNKNQQILEKIAKREPVSVPGNDGEFVLDEIQMQVIASRYNRAVFNIEDLFTK